MKRIGTLILAFFGAIIVTVVLLSLIGCGGGASYTPGILPVTAHADGFTNASLSGGYALGSPSIDVVQSLTFDGAGNITGTWAEETSNCIGPVTGNYSIESSGIGHIAVTFESRGAGCMVNQWQGRIVLAANGNTFFFSGLLGPNGIPTNGQGIKQ